LIVMATVDKVKILVVGDSGNSTERLNTSIVEAINVANGAEQNGQVLHFLHSIPGMDTFEVHKDREWTRASTICLIEARREFDDMFENPPCKKMQIWQQVAEKINAKGFHFTGEECDTKWRNILLTYKKNKAKVTETGRKQVSWEFYDMMDAFLADKVFNSRSNDTISSVMPVKCDNSKRSQGTPTTSQNYCEPDSDDDSSQVETIDSTLNNPFKRRKLFTHRRNTDEPPAWFNRFVEFRKEEFQRTNERESRRWEECKAIEERKIKAIQDMTEVLKKLLERTRQS